jgi:hypothetical protein
MGNVKDHRKTKKKQILHTASPGVGICVQADPHGIERQGHVVTGIDAEDHAHDLRLHLGFWIRNGS